MMTIIVAATRDMAIGRKGDLLYHISDDLKRFKSLTMGHPIIMGRKTFESFPKGALPGRRNIVVTRNASYTAENIETAPSVDEAVRMCAGADCFVIGGGEVYRQALPMADRLELTLIDAECPDADTRFPDIDLARYGYVNPAFDRTDSRSGVGYCFLTVDLKQL
ncbi:MAG: dihydrofolate reductase [Duncaniella sp.]|nr:dihydrofolate reductase [Duncaniella sp.]